MPIIWNPVNRPRKGQGGQPMGLLLAIMSGVGGTDWNPIIRPIPVLVGGGQPTGLLLTILVGEEQTSAWHPVNRPT